MNGFRPGKKLPKADVSRRVSAFNKKVEEYSSKSLEELKALYPNLKGTYKLACEQVTMYKLDAERIKISEEIGKTEEELKENRDSEVNITEKESKDNR